jgi:hypothetical protein
MKPKLYLHIGMNKNGTSTVQQYLTNNRKELMSQGICYPYMSEINNAHYELSNSFGFGPVSVCKHEHDDLINKIVAEAEGKNVVLSSEYFSLRADNSQLISLLSSHYELIIIVYIRNHYEWIQSLFNQATKTTINPPWEKGIEAFYKHCKENSNQILSYIELIQQWRGADSLVVRPFNKSYFSEGDLINDFLKVIGVDKGKIEDNSSEVSNESIPLNFLDAIDTINRVDFLTKDEKILLVNKIAKIKVDSYLKSKCILTQNLYDNITNDFVCEYEQLRAYMGEDIEGVKKSDQKFDFFQYPVFNLRQSIKMLLNC